MQLFFKFHNLTIVPKDMHYRMFHHLFYIVVLPPSCFYLFRIIQLFQFVVVNFFKNILRIVKYVSQVFGILFNCRRMFFLVAECYFP